jgi:hypothetical protein
MVDLNFCLEIAKAAEGAIYIDCTALGGVERSPREVLSRDFVERAKRVQGEHVIG